MIVDLGVTAETLLEMTERAEARLYDQNPDHEFVHYVTWKRKSDRDEEWENRLRQFSSSPDAKGEVVDELERKRAMTRYLYQLEIELGERYGRKWKKK